MNTEELQQLVARARTAEGETSRPPAGLLERASRAKRRHRRRVRGWIVAGALASVAALVLAPTWQAADDNVRPARASDPTSPDELRVTCTDTGPEVSATTVAAGPGGVVLVLDSTLPRGSYLTYGSIGKNGGPSGGDRLPRRPASTTYDFPPGKVRLGCATPPGMDEIDPVTVAVVDPHDYWRATTLADRGCVVPGPGPSWIGGLTGTGPTAEKAVGTVLANFAANVGRRYTAAPASTGYVDAMIQTWIASDERGPALTIRVTRTSAGYDAGPDVMCR